MSTTAKPIDILAEGLRDTAGAALASAKIRFYSPGTLVAATVYSDSACTTAYSQPITANAGGQATVYTLAAVRMIAKDSSDVTTYYDDMPNLQRADSVYVTAAGINGGAETTLEAVLIDIGTSFGDGFNYKESATATSRSYVSVIRNIAIQAADFGVVADGATDDTVALQAAIARVGALGGGRVLLPTGTIKLTAALTISIAGTNIEGNGRGISILKQYSTTANTLNVTLASGDCKLTLKGFSITASTTSSGKAINCSVGNYVAIEDVGVGLHRTGIDVSAITGGDLRHCFVDSTDDNASAIGISLGASGSAHGRCEVASATDNGIGIKFAGTDARAIDCYVTNFATAYSLTAARGQVSHCMALSSTTGFAVAAVADCVVVFNSASSCTTDLTLNASTTGQVVHGNNFVTISASTAAATTQCERVGIYRVNSSTVTDTFTPDVTAGKTLQVYKNAAASTPAITVGAATGRTSLFVGDIVEVIVANTSGFSGATVDWAASWTRHDGSAAPLSTSLSTGCYHWFKFRWDGTAFREITRTDNKTWG